MPDAEKDVPSWAERANRASLENHPLNAEKDAARLALESLWGCGPGEVVTEWVGADVDGGPGEIPVGQVCKSSAHTYAYWSGSCQFATEAAERVLPPGEGEG